MIFITIKPFTIELLHFHTLKQEMNDISLKLTVKDCIVENGYILCDSNIKKRENNVILSCSLLYVRLFN